MYAPNVRILLLLYEPFGFCNRREVFGTSLVTATTPASEAFGGGGIWAI